MTRFFTPLALLISVLAYSQAGIGTASPNTSAELEVFSSTKGILLPRVELKSVDDEITIENGNVESLLVYNTSNLPGIKPGYYYWSEVEKKWMRIVNRPDIHDETLTKLELKSETIPVKDDNGNDIPGQEMEVYTLIYTDENGLAKELDMNALVSTGETLTSLTYDSARHILIYTDEEKQESTFNLIDLVGEAETLTSLFLDIDNKRLKYKDEDKITHTLDLSPIIQEPWYNVATNVGAISNTDDLYTKGWVGIGYTSPSNAPNEKLRVNGTITSVNNYYADYVFEDYFDGYSELKDDYKFKSLDEVERFIKENRHLPGITPLNELEKTEKGYSFNMSALSIQLLEKSEELYLHLIDQKKQIDSQRILLEEQQIQIEDLKARLEKLEQLVK